MAESSREFYVGYLPVPVRQRRFLLRTIPVLLAAFVLLGFLFGQSQTNPGAGVWDDGHERRWTGRAVALPYPHLQPTEAPDELLLIVEVGKFGGGQRLLPFAGQTVEVRGYLLERDGRRMIELSEGPDAIQPSAAPMTPALHEQRGASATITGEIVDSKCYLGAMKPGAGKTHKACATLCIAGGIPAVFVTHQDEGRTYYLLSNRDGQPHGEALLPLVGETVRIEGSVGTLGSWQTLRCSIGQIQPL